jgi:hypothetical protein
VADQHALCQALRHDLRDVLLTTERQVKIRNRATYAVVKGEEIKIACREKMKIVEKSGILGLLVVTSQQTYYRSNRRAIIPENGKMEY